ncbi:aldehyde dehydrogenase family protein [Sorangium cellulosum]|uniref:aldehyde dehydrogenase family protein n=1 Tax=Sorangium cellulosum TaxID=56 RepID=UPI003D9A3FEB
MAFNTAPTVKVDGSSFTGSVAAGRSVARACGERGIRYQLRMDGKNPAVVLREART